MKLPGLLGVSLLTLAVIGGCTAAGNPSPGSSVSTTPGPLPTSVPQDFQIVWEAWNTLKEDSVYRDQMDPKKLSEGAVRGMLQALNDPHSSYLDPEEYQQENEAIYGTFDGIGAEVATQESHIIIVAPYPDTPAERAGIKPGDIILSVDGQSVEGLSLAEVVQRIRGPRGTSVTIGIVHRGDTEPVEITVTRDAIVLHTVRYTLSPEGFANVRISSFASNTDRELGEAISKMKADGAKGIILDLRNDPGGLLDTVIVVASRFLKDGLVLYEVDAHGEPTNWPVRRVERAPDVPMVVLVNEYSASASEVLSGALRDHQRATLVGEKTFGKGSVNTLRQLTDGSGIYFSVARWYTPNGTLIEGKGLTPDIVIEQSESNPPPDDPQLQRAVEVLNSKLGK